MSKCFAGNHCVSFTETASQPPDATIRLLPNVLQKDSWEIHSLAAARNCRSLTIPTGVTQRSLLFLAPCVHCNYVVQILKVRRLEPQAQPVHTENTH
mmetsp:Transcript_86867/g.153627  ORF Transcript_86867/g.153627 Transcript_86867/m.153627 type:complete len:97 (-) Transcript_86867:11-301(-)